MIKINRTIYWNQHDGSDNSVNVWLGIGDNNVSLSARELCCRAGLHSDSFAKAAENLYRLGQIRVSQDVLRKVAESEGKNMRTALENGELRPHWQGDDLDMIIVGTDGVMVPVITEAEKKKRQENRQNRQKKVKRRNHKRKARRKRGNDTGYKEFKILTFYDKDRQNQYTIGTSGDHNVLGKIMRREATKIGFDKADVKISVTDGASWISKQLDINLPMLDDKVLDYYHLSEHISDAANVCFGQGSQESQDWRDSIIEMLFEEGAIAALAQIENTRKALRSPGKRTILSRLSGYMAKRLDMLDYAKFVAAGYDIGSGPTEAMCKTLTRRLKGGGMKWDVCNAQSIMTLAAIQQSRLWSTYWQYQKDAA